MPFNVKENRILLPGSGYIDAEIVILLYGTF